MDRFPTSAVVRAAPMPTLGPGAGQLLLCAATRVGAEPGLPAAVGRGVYTASVLRSAQDDGVDATARPCSGPQASAAFAPGDGIDGGLRQAAFESESAVSQAFSVSVEGCGHRAAQPGVEHRAWELSITLEADFCVAVLERALAAQQPEILNTDQGVQFTSTTFQAPLLAAQVRLSMDGRGRAFDNIFVERLWRSVKYEEVYLKDYRNVAEARQNLDQYFPFYNEQRIHQALDYRTPQSVHFAAP